MSGLRPEAMRRFYARLHNRGEDAGTLAAKIGRSRATVARMLVGSRRRGPAWPALARLLEPAELALLDVAIRDPWNKKRIDRRPKWNPAKLVRSPVVRPRGLLGLRQLMAQVREEVVV